MNRADKRRRRRKLVLNKLGLSLCAFAALVVLAVLGILLIRSTLLRNARDTGTALSRSFAAEESTSLAMYETLLSFGTASLDSRLEAGEGRESIARFLELYHTTIPFLKQSETTFTPPDILCTPQGIDLQVFSGLQVL